MRPRDWRDEEIARLREASEEQAETIRQLREALTPAFTMPQAWALTVAQWRFFRALLARGFLSRDALTMALYAGQPDYPGRKAIDVLLCQLRRKLTRFGVTIETVWGQGYRLADRAAWAAHLAQSEPAPDLPAPAQPADPANRREARHG